MMVKRKALSNALFWTHIELGGALLEAAHRKRLLSYYHPKRITFSNCGGGILYGCVNNHIVVIVVSIADGDLVLDGNGERVFDARAGQEALEVRALHTHTHRKSSLGKRAAALAP